MSVTPVVDIHPHMIARDHERYPLQPLGGKQSVWSRERPVTCEELLEAMNQAGVDRSAVVHSSTAHGYDNSYLADSVDAHRDRIRGVCSVDVLADDAISKLEYWITDRGMVGLRLFTTGSTMPGQAEWFAEPPTFPAWQWASDHGIPVCVQMQLAGIPLLHTVLDRFPNLVVILDHLCGASQPHNQDDRGGIDGLLALGERPGVFLKMTTNNLRHFESDRAIKRRLVPELLDHYGSDRIAWGSNFPASEGSLEAHLDLARRQLSDYAEEVVENILGATALRLYPQLDGEAMGQSPPRPETRERGAA